MTRHRAWGHVLLQITILVTAFVAMVGFSVVLAKVTLTPSPASEDLVTSNLHPGRSLRQYAEDYTFLAACKQAGGNLVLGMPFGVLLPVLVPRRLRMVRMVLLTVLVIVVVELVQGALVAGRAFDIDDVILNTTGALLGYLLLGRLSESPLPRARGRTGAQGRPGPDPAAEARPPPDHEADRPGDRDLDPDAAGSAGRSHPQTSPQGMTRRRGPTDGPDGGAADRKAGQATRSARGRLRVRTGGPSVG